MSAEINYTRIQFSTQDMPVNGTGSTVGEGAKQKDQLSTSALASGIPFAIKESIAEVLGASNLVNAQVEHGSQNKSITVNDKKVPLDTTEGQLFWQKMFENGDQVLYNREKGPIKFDAFDAALKEAKQDFSSFLVHVPKHIRDIDTDFRGGRDAGDAKERLQRVGSLLCMLALFTAFDWGTSKAIDKPFNKILPLEGRTDKQYLAMRGGLRKVLEVMNDKYASVLGNMIVENLTGKRGFIHEVADKGADTITVGIDGWDDWVNGSSLESAQRILFQIPIAGALLEQGLTRLSMFQETSPLHTVTGKMIYMGLGVYMRTMGVGKKDGDKSLDAAIQAAT